MLPTVAGNWDRMAEYREKFNEDIALWVQGYPPMLRYYVNNRRELIDMLADTMPPLVAYNLFRIHGVKARRMIDLFAGIGGWSLGFALYAYPENVYIEAVELDRKKARILELLLKYVKSFYNELEFNVIIMDVRNYEVPNDIDVLTASPPCEDISPLNAFRGFKEYKHTVDLTRVFVEKVKGRNMGIFYENVYDKRLASLLADNGFSVEKVDFSQYIPQRRIRLIATKNVRRQVSLDGFAGVRR